MRARKTGTEIRQGEIAQAALDLIGSVGLQGLSIAAIAGRVGIVPSGVYRHFRSKDQVLDAVLDLLRSRLLGNVSAVCQETTDAIDRLKRLMIRHMSLLAENRAMPSVIFSEGFYVGHPERRNEVRQIITSYLAGIKRIVQEGRRQDSIRRDVAPATASVMFLGLVVPTAILRDMTGGQFDIMAHGRRVWPLFERAIRAPAPGQRPPSSRPPRRGARDRKEGSL